MSSASGAVFQVDYTTRSLDAVFQLHSAAINVLLVADGLAITGGDDRLLRAWPLDFRDYLLEVGPLLHQRAAALCFCIKR